MSSSPTATSFPSPLPSSPCGMHTSIELDCALSLSRATADEVQQAELRRPSSLVIRHSAKNPLHCQSGLGRVLGRAVLDVGGEVLVRMNEMNDEDEPAWSGYWSLCVAEANNQWSFRSLSNVDLADTVDLVYGPKYDIPRPEARLVLRVAAAFDPDK